jgi:phosphotransferase system enzyme I (PtsI)
VAEKVLQGIPASGGIAIGPGVSLPSHGDRPRAEASVAEEVALEVARYQEASPRPAPNPVEIESKVQKELGDEHAAIFQAHQIVLDDPLFVEEIPASIESRRLNAEFLLSEGLGRFKTILEGLEDPYFRERGGDVEDVGNRVLKNLAGVEKDPLKELDREVILVAVDLVALRHRQPVAGHRQGVRHRHRGTDVPRGYRGEILRAPRRRGDGDSDLRSAWTATSSSWTATKAGSSSIPTPRRSKSTVRKRKTTRRFIGAWKPSATCRPGPPTAAKWCWRGTSRCRTRWTTSSRTAPKASGLFRTEFLFLNRDTLPTEDEQFEVYREVAKKMGKHPTIVRTLDVGGDKFSVPRQYRGRTQPVPGVARHPLCA